MQKIRYWLAIFMGKSVSFLLKVLRKRVPYYPGYIALRICPDFLKQLKKPKLVIAITGTNGKTTISSLLTDAFRKLNYRVINNNGFNVKDGIAAMFLKDMSFFHKRADVVILEVDEKMSGIIFEAIPPQYLICTNLFRDSMKNNSNIEYIAKCIKEGIPKETKVIMPSDDLLVTSFISCENTIYYSLKMPSEKKKPFNMVCDLVYCPNCGEKLIYDYVYYHHIGKVHCPKCHYKNPKSKYRAEVDFDKCIIKVNDSTYPVQKTSIFNLYNLLSAITVLKELQIEESRIEEIVKEMKITDSRYSKETVNGIDIINHMAKGQNPVACSSVLDYVRKEPGKKTILLILDDVWDKKHSVETVAWYYDTDFEFLKEDNIKHILIGGVRSYDLYVRLLLAGIPKEKISLQENQFLMYQKLEWKDVDAIYILHDIHQYDQSLIIKKQIMEEIQ